MLFFKKKVKSKDVASNILDITPEEKSINEVAVTESAVQVVEEPKLESNITNSEIKVEKSVKKVVTEKTVAKKDTSTKTITKTAKNTAIKATKPKQTLTKKSNFQSSDKPIETKKIETTEKPKTTKKSSEVSQKSKKKSEERVFSGKVYHVTFRKDLRKWQIILGKGERAIKQFFTQDEAIDYAKELAEKNNGNMVIHMIDGKIRKQSYYKKKQNSETEK